MRGSTFKVQSSKFALNFSNEFKIQRSRIPTLNLEPGTLNRAERRHARLAILLLCSSLTFSACSGDSDNSSGASKDPDWQRGRAVYVANCVACHNNDPAKDGPLGPALKGSPQELVKFRVLRTEYPPGYKPKRDTKVMPTFPFLESEIKYLAAYLR
jgi:mono/diheme cytochrome c family protein